MSDTPIGLKTILEKVNNIEKVIMSDVTTSSSFVGYAINDIKTGQYMKLSSDITTFVQKFKNLIPANIDAFHDVVLICSTGVKYVEKNISKLGELMKKEITSDFKLNTCLNLVKEIVSNKHPEQLLISSINHIVGLLFPKSKKICLLKK
jgi:hypothetical protein